jgi:hypothetical protein
MQGLTLMQALFDRREKISSRSLEAKPGPSPPSPRKDLGHLVDSATTNKHPRIVRTRLEDNPAMPG